MTSTVTRADDKVFLGPQIDFQMRDNLLEDATKASFFIRLMAETLHRDEAELRRILLALGPDGLDAANLAADFITSRGKLLDLAALMKTAAGRVYMTLEEMEVDGEITTALRDPSSFSAVKLSFELSNIFDLSKASNLQEFANIISGFEMPEDLKVIGKSIKRAFPPNVVRFKFHRLTRSRPP